MSIAREIRRILVGGGLLLALNQSALAAVVSITGTASTNVQELVNGAPGSVSIDDDSTDPSEEELTARAASNIQSTDLEGNLVGMGQSFGDFFDPRRLDQPNPEEFGLEVACYSNAPGIAYVIESNTVEARTIVFSSTGTNGGAPEIEFGRDDTATVESRVFITGGVVFWSMHSAKDLSDMTADVQVTVSSDGTDTPLFDSTLKLRGAADGKVTTTTDGSMKSQLVSLQELADLGLDEDSLAILEELERTGTLQVIAIPSQEHAYQYSVTADESFVLTAELSARVANVPDGTGVAVVLGRPFANLAQTISNAMPVDGGAVERSINAAVAAKALGFVDDSKSTPTGMCGAMGSGGVAMLTLGLMSLCPLRRRS